MTNTYALPAQAQTHGQTHDQDHDEDRGQVQGRAQAQDQAKLPDTPATASEPPALVSTPQPLGPERLSLTPPLTRLPVELDVAVPVRAFRVRNLIGLESGQVVETQWEDTGDLPLAAGDVQLAWSEFEVVDTRMAVRITRLA
ncbi:MAG: FliM/FliN family flagellar motor C-terminal domain-containing protein [Terracidiphilus sp.]